MRKIIAQEMVTVDGYFAGPNGELDWFVWDDVLKNLSRDMLKSVDTLLFGRVTYDMMAAYWPTSSDEDPVIQKAMNGLPKIVFSRSLEKAEWNNTRLVREVIPEEIPEGNRDMFNPEAPDMTEMRAQLWRSRAFAYAAVNDPKGIARAVKKLAEINPHLLGMFVGQKKVHPLLEKEAKQIVMRMGIVPRKMVRQKM